VQQSGFQFQFVPDLVVHYRLRQKLRGLYRQSWNWGEEQALLRRLYKRPISKIALVKDSAAVLANVLRLVTVSSRAKLAGWVHNTAWYVGNLQGNAKYYLLGRFDETQYVVSGKVLCPSV